jgi:ubiquinone/menaquinone biosynthesis C-methylase UbiE
MAKRVMDYEQEARKRKNYFFDLYEGFKSASPWYLKWYDKKHIERKEWIQEELNNRLTKEKALVDIGCGSGYFLIKNANKVKKAIGVDVSEEYLKYARQNAEERHVEDKCTFVSDDLGDIEVEEESVVLCTQVLEHIDNEVEALTKMSDIGTTLVITVPGMRPTVEKLRKFIWPETDPAGHYRNYTLQQFRKKLESQGWELDKIDEIAKGKLSFNWIIAAVYHKS